MRVTITLTEQQAICAAVVLEEEANSIDDRHLAAREYAIAARIRKALQREGGGAL